MALTRVTAQLASTIAHLNQFADHLEGVAGNTLAWLLRVAANENFVIMLADAAGVSKFLVKDSAGATVATVDSDGNLTVTGTVTGSGALILPTSASPAQTADGSVVWDSDDNRLTVGDGASRKTFYPGFGLELVGVNTTEQTTTATGSTTMVTVTLTRAIAANEAVLITFNARKTTGGAYMAQITALLGANSVFGNFTWASTTNQTESASFWTLVPPYNAAYASTLPYGNSGITIPTCPVGTTLVIGGARASGTASTVVIKGNVENAAITMAVQDVRVYAIAATAP